MNGFEALPLQGYSDSKPRKPKTLEEQARSDAQDAFNGNMRGCRDDWKRKELIIKALCDDALNTHVKHHRSYTQEQRNWLRVQYTRYFDEEWRTLVSTLAEHTKWKEAQA